MENRPKSQLNECYVSEISNSIISCQINFKRENVEVIRLLVLLVEEIRVYV